MNRTEIIDACLALKPGQRFKLTMAELEAGLPPRRTANMKPLDLLALVIRDYIELSMHVTDGVVEVRCKPIIPARRAPRRT